MRIAWFFPLPAWTSGATVVYTGRNGNTFSVEDHQCYDEGANAALLACRGRQSTSVDARASNAGALSGGRNDGKSAAVTNETLEGAVASLCSAAATSAVLGAMPSGRPNLS